MNNVLFDSCYWLGLYDPRDQHHHKAQDLSGILESSILLLPHPTLYETINSRLARRWEWAVEFEKIIYRQNTVLIEDSDYKDIALDLVFSTITVQKRPLSLVDIIIRLIIEDQNIKVDSLISFNVSDFYDVCQRNSVQLISE